VSVSSEFTEFVRDQLAGVGPVTVRRMFGGAGIFANGIMFALIANDTLFLKADAQSSPEFLAEGLKPFEFNGKNGKRVYLGYFRCPERCLDDPSEMTLWARKAQLAAVRAATKSASRRKD
jgi:DNA transformation protein